MMKAKPFAEFSFESEHPVRQVADHEVLLSFNNDSDAIAFREWLDGDGMVRFQKYLDSTSTE